MIRGLQLATTGVLLAIVVLRAIVSVDPFPGWSDDPTRLPMVFAGLGAGQESALDLAALVLAMASVAASGARGMGPRCWELALGAVGMGGAMAHARWLHPGDPESLAVSVNWCAAVGTALAMRGAARDPLLLRVCAAALLGLMGMLAAKAMAQFVVEQPQAYADFKSNKATILSARGWTEGSSMAQSFERRISQREAVGWFGLSNVFGSVCAGAGAALVGLLAADGKARAGRSFVVLGAVLAGLALALSMSKGAIVAGVLGLALLAVATMARSRRPGAWGRWGGFVGLACIAGPLALVAVRGAIGERLGELSLWFRWFYWQGAASIAKAHPWLGVGPGNFQDAYVACRPALSPEAAASPHSVLIDFASCLGAMGLAWGGLVVIWAWKAGRRAAASVPEPAPRTASELPALSPRAEIRLVVAIGAAPLVVAALLERETASPLSTGVRAAGLVLMGLVGAGVLTRGRIVALGPVLGVGALAMLAHAQIEMTGTTAGSSMWFFAVLALAAGVEGRAAARPARRLGGAVGLAMAAGAVGVLGPVVANAWRWEADLRRAASEVRPLAMARALAGASVGAEGAHEAAAVLGEALGRRVGEGGPELDAAMGEVEARALPRALEMLRSATAREPRHFGTHRALSEVLVRAGIMARVQAPDLARRLVEEAESEMAEFAQRVPGKSSAWSWLGTLRAQLAEGGFDLSARARAADAWVRASEVDRTGVGSIPQLVEALGALGRTDEAKAWAAKGLERHANQRLDPLAGLTEAQKRRLEAAAGR